MTTTNEVPARCECGYNLAVMPCPYHGVSRPRTTLLPVTANMVRRSPVFAAFRPEAVEAIARSAGR